jgi:hypothetical protein
MSMAKQKAASIRPLIILISAGLKRLSASTPGERKRVKIAIFG